ncbi:MAG: glycosyltransferase family 2 protein [Chloroflexota bacterium]|nr:glycosyltransferase family 2 protein [Chloroflexota bacterium]
MKQDKEYLPTDKSGRQNRARIVVTIPCFNEADFIGDVVRRTTHYVDEVIVVDDGSNDNTSELAREAGALVVRHPYRRGAGAATRTCFKTAIANGADIVVTMDGDNQHYPEEIPQLIAPLLRNEADLVIGSRFLGSDCNTPRYRELGIRVITTLLNFGSKVAVSDAQSCFRAHDRALIDSLSITEDGFGFSIEVLMEAERRGLRITEVSTRCLYHSQCSTMNPIRHGFGLIVVLAKLRLKYLRSRWNRNGHIDINRYP